MRPRPPMSINQSINQRVSHTPDSCMVLIGVPLDGRNSRAKAGVARMPSVTGGGNAGTLPTTMVVVVVVDCICCSTPPAEAPLPVVDALGDVDSASTSDAPTVSACWPSSGGATRLLLRFFDRVRCSSTESLINPNNNNNNVNVTHSVAAFACLSVAYFERCVAPPHLSVLGSPHCLYPAELSIE
jgi:hypothetical protein